MQHALLIPLVLAGSLLAQLPKIAVLDFTSTSLPEREVKAITDKLSQELYKSGYVDIMERSNIAKVFEEQGLQQTGAFNEEGAVNFGKVIGVHKVLFGSVERVDKVYVLNVRLVDVETGRVEHMVSHEQKGSFSKLLQEGIPKVVKELTREDLGLKPIVVDFAFVAIRNGSSFFVRSGDTLQSGDRIHITVKPNQRCYVYIVNQDTRGNVYSLFPNPAQRYRALEAGMAYHIPGEGRSFELDDIVGKEYIYISASLTPLDDIEKLIFKNEPQVVEKEQLLHSIATRGLARIVKGGDTVIELEQGMLFKGLSDRLAGAGAFRYTVVFEHVSE